jgi:drug/metabolite transporter (DMT)-like permease
MQSAEEEEAILKGIVNPTGDEPDVLEEVDDGPRQFSSPMSAAALPKDVNPTTSADVAKEKAEESAKAKALLISFLLMLIFGLGNKIFQVLMFRPMNNYPLFTNLLTTFVYLPTSFSYIFFMIRYGSAITPDAQQVPKRVFAVMGLLDSIAGIMQTLAVNYIANGSLVILLTQSAIPISMLISRWLLKTKYKIYQFIGAIVVTGGLVLVLVPNFIHPPKHKEGDPEPHQPIVFCFVLILSCVPMCLSSVYKEKALGDTELDAIYLNGWVAWYQFLASFPLLLPSAPASNLSVNDIPKNLWDGARCYVGINSILTGSNADNCHWGPLFVNIYMFFNLGYNILIILILKYGSSNVLWLAMTIMVPLGNIAFALPFMPGSKPLRPTDITGLVVIMSGLIVYRFYEKIEKAIRRRFRHYESDASKPLLDPTTAPTEPTTPQSPAFWEQNASTPAGSSTPIIGGQGHGVHSGGHQSVAQDRSQRRAMRNAIDERGGSSRAQAMSGRRQPHNSWEPAEGDQ